MECIEFFELSMISREKEKGGYNKKEMDYEIQQENLLLWK